MWTVLPTGSSIGSILWCKLKPLGCCIKLVVIAPTFVVGCLVEGVLGEKSSPSGCEVKEVEA